jgi:hypothetical protein
MFLPQMDFCPLLTFSLHSFSDVLLSFNWSSDDLKVTNVRTQNVEIKNIRISLLRTSYLRTIFCYNLKTLIPKHPRVFH